MDIVKTLSQMAAEFTLQPKTFYNHIQKHECLKTEIKQGLQLPKQQKLIYDKFGYPPSVNKNDYENI
jgi:hypothetical protein